MYRVATVQQLMKVMGVFFISLMLLYCGDDKVVTITELDTTGELESHEDIQILKERVNDIALLIDTLTLIDRALSKESDPSRVAVFERALQGRVELITIQIQQLNTTIDSLEQYNSETLALVSENSDPTLVAEQHQLRELLQQFKSDELLRVDAFQGIAEHMVKIDSLQSSSIQAPPIGVSSSNDPSDVLSSVSSHAWSLASSSLVEVDLSTQTSSSSSNGDVDNTHTEISSSAELLSSISPVSSATDDTLIIASSSSSKVISSSSLFSSSSIVVVLSSSSVSLSSVQVLSSQVVSSSESSSSVDESSAVFIDETEILNINEWSHVTLPRFNDDWENNGMTIEAWVLWDTFSNDAPIIHLSNGLHNYMVVVGVSVKGNNYNALKFNVLNNERGTNPDDWAGALLDSAFVAGQWTHVAVTVAIDGVVSMYINGAEKKSVNAGMKAVPANTDRNVNYLGKSAVSSDGHFDGRIDNVRIWNRVRTSVEIEANMYSVTQQLDYTSGLIVSYDFNYLDTNVVFIKDQSGNNNDALLEGASGSYGSTGTWRSQVDFTLL
ncbi:MAG: LamG domain-containing protein [Fibrobacterales bacterium]